MIDQHKVEEVARRSGLQTSTVTDLLNSGYAYVEQIAQHPKWVKEPKLVRSPDVGSSRN